MKTIEGEYPLPEHTKDNKILVHSLCHRHMCTTILHIFGLILGGKRITKVDLQVIVAGDTCIDGIECRPN